MKKYKLNINDNSYTVVINDVTDDAILAEVNGRKHVVLIHTIENIRAQQTSVPNEFTPVSPSPSLPLSTGNPSSPVIPEGNIITPIPGQIISINVTVGEKVRAGQKLLVLEAMKLENSITTDRAGTVTEILVAEGDVVGQGQTLLVIN